MGTNIALKNLSDEIWEHDQKAFQVYKGIPDDINLIINVKDISLRELAKLMGVSDETTRTWRDGKCVPNLTCGLVIHYWAEDLRSRSKQA